MPITRGIGAFVRWMATSNDVLSWWCAICWQYSPHAHHQWSARQSIFVLRAKWLDGSHTKSQGRIKISQLDNKDANFEGQVMWWCPCQSNGVEKFHANRHSLVVPCFHRVCRQKYVLSFGHNLGNLSVKRVHDCIFCCQNSLTIHVSLVCIIDCQGRENNVDEGI